MTTERLKELIEVKEAELEGLKLLLQKSPAKGAEDKASEKAAKKEKGGKGLDIWDGEKKAPEPITSDYESHTGQELYAECGRRGLTAKCKSRTKENLIAVLKQDDKDGGAGRTSRGKKNTADDKPAEKKGNKAEAKEADEWGEEADKKENPYEGKKASELYKECVSRGIEAKIKMSSEYYAGLLIEDDNKQVDEWEGSPSGDDFDEDDWEID